MDNYKLSTINELENDFHSYSLDSNCIKMMVKSGSKVNNLLNYAHKAFQKDDVYQLTWNASSDALSKAVACAELMKKTHVNLYQINKIGFKRQEELWEPTVEGLRPIKVTKEIPSICIILSKKELNTQETGYQDTKQTLDSLFSNSTQPTQQNTKNNKRNVPLANDDKIYFKKKSTNFTNKK